MRVVVIGGPATGKTTLARALAAGLGVEYIELDAVAHGPGGTEPTREEFRSVVLPKLDAEGWIVDGWHEHRLGTHALERANLIIFLDPLLAVALWRLVRRSAAEIVLRKELWNGNRQTWRGAFGGRHSLLGYALWRYPDLRRKVPVVMGDPRLSGCAYVRLRSLRAARRWVREWLPERPLPKQAAA